MGNSCRCSTPMAMSNRSAMLLYGVLLSISLSTSTFCSSVRSVRLAASGCFRLADMVSRVRYMNKYNDIETPGFLTKKRSKIFFPGNTCSIPESQIKQKFPIFEESLFTVHNSELFTIRRFPPVLYSMAFAGTEARFHNSERSLPESLLYCWIPRRNGGKEIS